MEAPSIYIGGVATSTSRDADGVQDTWTPLAASQLVDISTAQTFTVKCEPWWTVGNVRPVTANQVEIRDVRITAIATGPISAL